MKKVCYKTAYTLIELIVSLVLVSFIAMGIIAINNGLNNNNQDYGQRYSVKSQTQTALNHILNNASLAAGSGTTINGMADLGVLHGSGVQSDGNPGAGDANSLCIHQSGSNNILGSASDIWLCYTLTSSQIYYCTMSYNSATSPYRGAAAPCISTSANYTFLGTAYSWSSTYTSSAGLTVTINNCLNDSAASCFSSSPDPVNNPQVTISGSVIPPQQGNG